jgi:hypothetical protein
MEQIIITSVSVCVASLSFVWGIYQHFDVKKREQDSKEFDNYHKLIKELVQPDENGLYIDRQCAILFELRNFKRYYPFSYRTLVALKKKWDVPDQFPRLIEELNLTICFLEKKIK